MSRNNSKLRLESAEKFTKPYIYVGVAEDMDDLNQRRYSHERNGYEGIMYYHVTEDMRKSENYYMKKAQDKGFELLNEQLRSNVSQEGGAKKGYIYVIWRQ